MTQNALRILKYANTMEVYELSDAIKNLSAEKQNINDYLDIFQFWFRDVLMFKATRELIIWYLTGNKLYKGTSKGAFL
mgnify:CR=1 FL=1